MENKINNLENVTSRNLFWHNEADDWLSFYKVSLKKMFRVTRTSKENYRKCIDYSYYKGVPLFILNKLIRLAIIIISYN